MKPIDRFGLDLGRVRHLATNSFSDELFLLESTRKVRVDNTFSFNNTRYEAPRDLRNTTITIRHDPAQWITPVINRSLHTWPNLLRLLCQAMEIDLIGNDSKCETRLINEARTYNAQGKTIIPIIDDAHLLPIDALHKLRLLLEDFPKNHNLILIGQPALNTTLQLSQQQDLKSRVTYSAKIDALAPTALTAFIHHQLDLAGLPHTTFTEEAVNLILRASEGTLRAVKNLCVGSLIEAVRDQTRTVDLKQVNAVLMQPHWRHNARDEPAQPVVLTNQKPRSK
jgi:hypothetical protein